jgi:hypothetical protein
MAVRQLLHRKIFRTGKDVGRFGLGGRSHLRYEGGGIAECYFETFKQRMGDGIHKSTCTDCARAVLVARECDGCDAITAFQNCQIP